MIWRWAIFFIVILLITYKVIVKIIEAILQWLPTSVKVKFKLTIYLSYSLSLCIYVRSVSNFQRLWLNFVQIGRIFKNQERKKRGEGRLGIERVRKLGGIFIPKSKFFIRKILLIAVFGVLVWYILYPYLIIFELIISDLT